MEIKKFNEFSLEENKKEKPSFGCVMVFFTFPDIKDVQDIISKEDLYTEEDDDSYGLEKNPHITLLYGLHSNDIKDQDVMDAVDTSVFTDLILHNASIFKSEKYGVLKFDVRYPYKSGAFLSKLNKKLSEFPHTNTFPDYHPHSTIAYLKSGTSKKYIDLLKDKEFTVTPNKIVYSKIDNSEVTKPIKIEKND